LPSTIRNEPSPPSRALNPSRTAPPTLPTWTPATGLGPIWMGMFPSTTRTATTTSRSMSSSGQSRVHPRLPPLTAPTSIPSPSLPSPSLYQTLRIPRRRSKSVVATSGLRRPDPPHLSKRACRPTSSPRRTRAPPPRPQWSGEQRPPRVRHCPRPAK
jgi:hypothetical protein